MLRILFTGLLTFLAVVALYFPNAAVLTRRDVGRQFSLNFTGSFVAYVTYNSLAYSDDTYAQGVRITSSGSSVTLSNLTSTVDSSGLVNPRNFTSPITIFNDNNDTSSENSTDFVIYFVRASNGTIPFPVYSIQNGSITVTSDLITHGVTILNAKPSLIASTFMLRTLIPVVRVASCGFDSATNEDYSVLDITSQRQSFSFHILNGPIATFYDPKAANVSFTFTLAEATSLDRKIPPGAEFTLTSAGFATINSSYNVDPGLTLKQNYDFGKDVLTQLVTEASDFRDGEKIRFIASGSKKSVDHSLNTTDTIYDPDVFATTIALTVTTNDTTHYPRFRIRVVSGSASLNFACFLIYIAYVIIIH